jgi:hypothetical protein
MRSIYIFALLIQTVLANWQGCITEDEQLSGKVGVVKEQDTAVCLTVAIDSDDWADPTDYRRFSFAPQADDYSRFVVDESYMQLVQSNFYTNVTAFASSQTSLSFQRKYYEKSVGVFPYLTAIIDVVDGEVKGIAWDDACVFCGKERCAENTFDFTGSQARPQEPTKGCFLTVKECNDIHSKGGNTCDLRLHVVWTGTDKNGIYLTSSSKRFSAFSPKQIRDSFKDALNKIKSDVSGSF